MTITSTASEPVPHSPHERRFFRLIPWGMAHTVLMLWITGMAVILAGQNGHPAVHSRLLEIKPSLYASGLLAVLLAAGCHICRRCRRMQPLLSPRVTTFCVAAFMLGLLSFLLYAGLTASYAPPDSASQNWKFPPFISMNFPGAPWYSAWFFPWASFPWPPLFRLPEIMCPESKTFWWSCGACWFHSCSSSSSVHRNRKEKAIRHPFTSRSFQ